ncbi:MAG: indole-3-glycerol phosphate synthase TrpC [Deltaproteobacteria bacterium]|nr:indole-3-glycerol phosphate synthase TrpC [Deltaproteobacteria bacterium]MCL4874030.1 indole-3-glycerol phosphate synthase TrpC [bacterium]
MILDDILQNKRLELEKARAEFPIDGIMEKLPKVPKPKDFERAVAYRGGADRIRIIAEIKRGSPSKGMIREYFVPAEIARGYIEGGAAAISVITDEKFFMGKLEYLTALRGNIRLPLLRKDFIIDEYQVYESRVSGADALLLIVAALPKDGLKKLLELTYSLGMSALVEVHDEKELETALDVGARIIGVNNRDLKTFKTDLETTARLAPYVPKDRVLVSESGINTHEDILRLRECGVEAFLIGEALMREENFRKKLRELRGVKEYTGKDMWNHKP